MPLTLALRAVCVMPPALQNLKDKEYEAGVLARTPMNRLGQPEDISGGWSGCMLMLMLMHCCRLGCCAAASSACTAAAAMPLRVAGRWAGAMCFQLRS